MAVDTDQSCMFALQCQSAFAFELLNVSESVANGAKFSSGREGGNSGAVSFIYFQLGGGGGWLQEFDAPSIGDSAAGVSQWVICEQRNRKMCTEKW